MTLRRTPINPVAWSQKLGFHQAVLLTGPTRTLYCSGQTATDAEGNPLHEGDMAAQLALSLDNLEAVLAGAGMTLADLVRLTLYTTDIDALFPHYATLTARLATVNAAPPTTLLEVSRLAIPTQLIELEATAAA